MIIDVNAGPGHVIRSRGASRTKQEISPSIGQDATAGATRSRMAACRACVQPVVLATPEVRDRILGKFLEAMQLTAKRPGKFAGALYSVAW